MLEAPGGYLRPRATIYLSPAGETFTQATAKRFLAEYGPSILVCGHYEELTNASLRSAWMRRSPWEILSSQGGRSPLWRWQMPWPAWSRGLTGFQNV
jgi:hypothetical protein